MPVQSHAILAATAVVLAGQIRAGTIPYHLSSPSSLSVAAIESSTCSDSSSHRTIWDIIWSCATTIFLCTWVSLHPRVPSPTFTRLRITVVRILAVIISFLAPEWAVGTAAADWWEAQRHKSPFQGWTPTHTWFTLMGGFVETRHWLERPLDLEPIEKLTSETHPELLAPIPNPLSRNAFHGASAEAPPAHSSNQDAVPLLSLPTSRSFADDSTHPKYHILVTEAAIRDRSKINTLAKLIAVAQTTWFIVQFIERWVTHQPRTQLEVMTVAYAALNAVLYALYWNKPYNVDEPIHVSGRAHDRFRTRTVGVFTERSLLSDAFKAISSGDTPHGDVFVSPVVSLTGVLFGGLHCLAWKFHFPTEQEAMAWRVCAVYCTVAPAVLVLPVLFVETLDGLKLPGLVEMIIAFGLAWSLIGYIVCRLILLALTLSSLRVLPAGVFETTAWTKFIPHIS